MGIIDSLKKRRTYYNINKDIPVSENEIEEKIKEITELVPDAFNMKSSRIVILFNKKHELLWDKVFDVFNGKISKEKINEYKSGYGTILFLYDEEVVNELQDKFSIYSENFPIWANQSNGMLQFSIWTALRELNIGASLQHYNPIIDEEIKKIFDIPLSYKMIAQMPFGGIVNEPNKKEKEDINKRVRIIKD